MSTFFAILGSVLAVSVAVVAVIYIIVPVAKGIEWVVRSVFKFIFSEIGDVLRIVGSLITTLIFTPLVLFNIIFGRWSASSHYGGAIKREMIGIGHCVYRLVIGNPARLFGLANLVEGIEKRVPDAMVHAPTADTPSRRTGQFDGYKIVGSLRGGGSGAKIYIADPDTTKLAIFARAGRPDVTQVVVKSFSLKDGSSLPQIVRESRALEAAKKIGLVLEHELNDQRFYYVMPYVPGDDLGLMTRRLHDASGPDGLDARRLAEAVGYVADLLGTLDRYHRGGLWHKDVKPDNIIVSGGRAHVVDLGLVTPLSSGMTLTTHGTEYFRDPEMVRLALKGVKVHEVDGAKFDIYAAGAVMYSVIENSFPAHGGLSQVTKRCPEAMRWIIRRAMTDYSSRYGSAREMLADVQTVLAAADPHTVRPIDLPSMAGLDPEAGAAAVAAATAPVVEVFAAGLPRAAQAAVGAAGAAFAPAAAAFAAGVPGPRGPLDPATAPAPGAGGRVRPNLRISDWWRGRYMPAGEWAGAGEPAAARGGAAQFRQAPRVHPGMRAPAHEQLERARRRVSAAQERARARRGARARYKNSPNAGVGVALVIFLGVCVVGGVSLFNGVERRAASRRAEVQVHRLDETIDRITEQGVRKAEAARVRIGDAVERAGRRFADVIVSASGAVRTAIDAMEESQGRIEIADGAVVIDLDENDPDTESDEGQQASAGAGAGASRAQARSGASTGAWLVINDATYDRNAEAHADIQRRLSRVKRAGFTLVGLGDTEEDVETLAAARAVIGVGVPNDPGTEDRLTAWIRERSPALAGVVWIEMALDGSEAKHHLFAHESRESTRMERLLNGPRR